MNFLLKVLKLFNKNKMELIINNKKYSCDLKYLETRCDYFKCISTNNFVELKNQCITINFDLKESLIIAYLNNIKMIDSFNIFINEDLLSLLDLLNLMNYLQDNQINKILDIITFKIKNLTYINDELILNLHENVQKELIDWKTLFFNKNLLVDENYLGVKNIILQIIKYDPNQLKLLKYWGNLIRENENFNEQIMVNYFDFVDYLKYCQPDINKIHWTESKFKINESVCQYQNIDHFKSILFELSCGIIKEDLDWTNIIIAGGILLYPNERSDIDFWLYNLDDQTMQNKIKYLLNYFKNQANGQTLYYSQRNHVISIIIKNIPRVFQIICTSYENQFEVIKEFDFDCLHTIYNGENLLTTFECLKSLKYQTIFKIYWKPKKYRLYKLFKKGFSFGKKTVQQNFKELEYDLDFKEYINELITNKEIKRCVEKYFVPVDDDILQNIDQIKKIFDSDFVTNNLQEFMENLKKKNIKADPNFDEINPYANYPIDHKYIDFTKLNLIKSKDKYFYNQPIEIKNYKFKARTKSMYGDPKKISHINLQLNEYPEIINLFKNLDKWNINYFNKLIQKYKIKYYRLYGIYEEQILDEWDDDDPIITKRIFKKFQTIILDLSETHDLNLHDDKQLELRYRYQDDLIKEYPSFKIIDSDYPWHCNIKCSIFIYGFLLSTDYHNNRERRFSPIIRLKNIIFFEDNQRNNL